MKKLHDFDSFVNEATRNQSKRPTFRVLAEIDQVVLATQMWKVFMIFKKDFAKESSEDFKNVNLGRGYFTGTAIVGSDKGKKAELKDYSSPFHKGQVIEEPEEDEDDDVEEFDFIYNRNISDSVIRKLADEYCKHEYVKGTVVQKLILH